MRGRIARPGRQCGGAGRRRARRRAGPRGSRSAGALPHAGVPRSRADDGRGAGGRVAFAGELLELVRRQGALPLAYLWIVDLALALVALGRGAELAAAAPRPLVPTPWNTAGQAIARGDARIGAEALAAIGALPEAALARMCAASSLAEAGRAAEAEAQLELALAFYRSVGAAAAIAEGEQLLAAAR